jgi:hypothetical protein
VIARLEATRRALGAGLFPVVQRELEALALCQDLDQVAGRLKAAFPGWFVYRGGSHVALHVSTASARVAIVTEERGAL